MDTEQESMAELCTVLQILTDPGADNGMDTKYFLGGWGAVIVLSMSRVNSSLGYRSCVTMASRRNCSVTVAS